jgi:arsenite/tail-anchored protein-transporting ATPase
VEKDLEIQEIDVQEEVFRHWNQVHQYFSALFSETGMQEVVAEDLALIPGMEDVVALLYLNDYTQQGRHDVIILDLAPTGESLRFVSMPDTLDWYMRRIFRFERNLMRAARPIARRISKVPLPDDSYFEEIQRLWQRMEGVDKILTDPERATVRLVTNPERMVIKETQRAHLYFSLHGVVVDEILVNRILPEPKGNNPFYQGWYDTQQKNLAQIEALFPDLPLQKVPLMDDEVVGIDRLAELAHALYGPPTSGRDPAAMARYEAPYQVETATDETLLRVHLPHLDKTTLDLWVEREELILRVASQKHHLPLPRRLGRQQPTSARYEDNWLTIRFPNKDQDPAEDPTQTQTETTEGETLQVDTTGTRTSTTGESTKSRKTET